MRTLLPLLLAMLLLAACGRSDDGSAADATLRIAVVPKGTTHDFWKTVHAGAVKAERELGGVEVTFRGPEREDDREQQVALVQNLVAGDYDAIVLAPLDDRALVAPVRLAGRANIPVVIIDSGLDATPGDDFVSFVATDNYAGGRLAAEAMAGQLGPDGGRVLVLRYQEGSESTRQREQGFIEGILAAPGVEVVDPGRYAGPTRATAQEAAENLLGAYDDVDAIFCPNESSTFGMLLALRVHKRLDDVRFVGFDSSEGLVDALRAGDIDALVVQSPMRMGFLGVKTAVDHLRGVAVDTRVDTGVVVVTKDTMDEPDVRELLSPDLDAYLGDG